VTNSVFWIEWRLFGMDPTGYHVVNLSLHIAAAFLIWAVLNKLSIPGGFFAALLFAIHPVNVESVAWISQHKNTLAMLFFLISIWCYLKGEEHRLAPDVEVAGLGFNRWHWLSLLGFVAAMLSKGSVAMLPGILLVIVWWMHRKITAGDLIRTTPFFAATIVLTCANVWFQSHGEHIIQRNASWLERTAGAGGVGWFYLTKALVPIRLCFSYPQWEIDMSDFRWWLPLVATLTVTAVLAWQCKSRVGRPLFAAWLYFCLALVPVMGFVDISFMRYSLVSNHYEHLAIIGVIVLATVSAYGLRERLRNQAQRRILNVSGIAVASVFFLLTINQSQLYSGPIELYQSTLQINPDSIIAHNNLAIALAKAGRFDEALPHIGKVAGMRPESAEARNNVGMILAEAGRLQDALVQFEQSVELNPDYADAHANLGGALLQFGRLEEAIQHYQRAIAIRPELAVAHNNLAIALGKTGRQREAIEHYRRALELRPNYLEASVNLAAAYAQANQPVEAANTAEQALKLARSSGRADLAQHLQAWLSIHRR
jgi:tetratricopeptide (TPR) repeat protein